MIVVVAKGNRAVTSIGMYVQTPANSGTQHWEQSSTPIPYAQNNWQQCSLDSDFQPTGREEDDVELRLYIIL